MTTIPAGYDPELGDPVVSCERTGVLEPAQCDNDIEIDTPTKRFNTGGKSLATFAIYPHFIYQNTGD